MYKALDVDADVVWTPEALADMLAEPRDSDLDWRRFEIVDGVLVVSPPSLPLHEVLVMQVGAALLSAVPESYRVAAAVGIRLGRSYRVTDVTVVAESVVSQSHFTVAPEDVLLVVEIESPSSVTTDRITKPAQYAAAGITHYWRLETDPLHLVTYRLAGEVYVETGAYPGARGRLTDPFPVEVDLTVS